MIIIYEFMTVSDFEVEIPTERYHSRQDSSIGVTTVNGFFSFFFLVYS